MTDTLKLVPDSGKGGVAPSTRGPQSRRWGGSGKSDPVSVYLAPRLGLAPKTIEHMLRHGPRAVNELCAEIVRAFLALGDHIRLARFLAPVKAAEAGFQAPLSAELVRRAQEADAAEDVAETTWLLSQSDEELHRYRHRLQLQLATTLELLTAVEGKLGAA